MMTPAQAAQMTFDDLCAMPNGPDKKFYLLKLYADRLPIPPTKAREFGCDEIVAMMTSVGESKR